MILSGNTIKQLVEKKELIENANLSNIKSSSYDVTNTEYILKFKKQKEAISLLDKDIIDNMYEKINIKDGYIIKPNECILVPLQDSFKIPSNICGYIKGRTSFNRIGLNIAIQHLHPGYQGKLNLTITNMSPNSYTLLPNITIAQIVFETLDTAVATELLYYNEVSPSYQNEDGYQGSKIYTNFIGKVFRHFKGNYYYIEDVCLDSETKESIIIYRTLYNRKDSNIWTRPAKMFFESIDSSR